MGRAEATRERILDAAMAEFSAHGVAGARVDRIAATAGCNKNLIYVYFENKETLFATLLDRHLSRVYEELEFTPDDLPGYAGRVFDFAMANPDLMRLMAWSALEGSAAEPDTRTRAYAGKVEKMESASTLPPRFLLTAIMTLATAWTAANPFGPSLNPEAATRPAELRDHIEAAVRRLTTPDAV